MSKKLKFTKGNTTIEMDDAMHALVEKTLKEIAPTVVDAMENSLDRIYKEALTEWPVKTGRSKRALDWEIRVSENAIQGTMFNPVDYVIYIKGDNQGGKSTWITLIRRPMNKDAKRIAEETAEELVALRGD